LETINLPTCIEMRPVAALLPFARNSRIHSEAQVAQVAASIREFGWTNPVLVGADGVIIAGHARVLAARKLEMTEVPVIVLGHLSETQRRALVIADNRLALNAGWDEEVLRAEMQAIEAAGFDLEVVGFSDEEIRSLLAEPEVAPTEAPGAEEEIPEAPSEPVTRAGDIWMIGRHRLICGDCRDLAVVHAVLGGAAVNIAITSPPYASQRAYDPSSGFQPVPPGEYLAWFRDVAANIATILTPDGSYFLNIKEHADGGQRNLYVKKLTIAHVEQWGWRFVDEFCWRKTDDGVPGGWGNRFKNAWEPVFHFCRQEKIKFRPKEVGHWSDDCFDYSPDNPKSTSGSGLLGTGPRGAAADQGKNHDSWQTTRRNANNLEGRHGGIARPSNVIEVKTESTQGSHSAPFPRALVEFFVKAVSDVGDAVFDPFTGSGTTMAAAHVLDRVGYGCEISPAYCDVILRRISQLAGVEPVLVATGQRLSEVAAERGVRVCP
jgi:DNA modification methylase